MKSGDARVALVGFPSVGKSTLLTKLTGTESVAAAYEFTTLTCIPGNIEYEGATIQLLDLPGIIEGAAEGRGRGKQVIAVARTADLILIMLDAAQGTRQRAQLEHELFAMGVRLNKQPPQVSIRVKAAGGISFNATCKLTRLTEAMANNILREYKMFNCEVLVREDCSVDDFIDAIHGKCR